MQPEINLLFQIKGAIPMGKLGCIRTGGIDHDQSESNQKEHHKQKAVIDEHNILFLLEPILHSDNPTLQSYKQNP